MNGLIKVEFILHDVKLLRLDWHDGFYGSLECFDQLDSKARVSEQQKDDQEKGNYLVNFRRKMVGPR